MGVHFKENEERITLGMIIAGIAFIAVLMTILIVFLINTKDNNFEEGTSEEQTISNIEEGNDEFETVSIDIGKKVEEAENELKNIIAENTTTNSINSNDIKTSENSVMTNSINTTNNTEKKENTLVETHSSATEKTEEKKEVKFNAPIKGEIIREFAPDALVYSETLEEWVTHNGVDIKADKTSVVVACAKGTVTAIKNDPRYGITVIVTHDDGYQSVYANLLTAEYVVEGENIEAGQTIGTIGNSASFEIADEYHLHFELLKNGDYVNPENLITFE